MPESNDRDHSAETSALAAPGKVKIDICRRLGDGWPELADYVQIPSHERRQFRQGFEAQAIWEWLDRRSRLRELPEALRYIGRHDLADLWAETQRQSAGRYYRDCIERWSSPRYALDKRFVQLTLLLDQGEETQGPHAGAAANGLRRCPRCWTACRIRGWCCWGRRARARARCCGISPWTRPGPS